MPTIVSPQKTENKVTVTESPKIVTVSSVGTVGPRGGAGTYVLSGNGAPASSLGADGDHYLDQTGFHLYVKSDGAWGDQGAYGGAQGPAGTITSVTASTSAVAAGGTPTVEVAAGGSNEAKTLAFAFGAVTGADGKTWTSSSSGGSGGSAGDFHFNTTTEEISKNSSGTWSVIADVSGTNGTNGLGFKASGTGYTSSTGVVAFASDDGLGFSTSDLRGADGADGADGTDGTDGADGTDGTDGTNGKTILNGTGEPDSSVGVVGDFYVDTSADTIYGPKDSSGSPWGSGVSFAVANGSVTLAKMANLATDKIIGRTTAGTGVPEALSVHDILNMAGTPSDNHILKYDSTSSQWVPEVDVDTDTVYTHPNHTGEVTSTNDGATVIVDNKVDEANLMVSNDPTNGQFLSAQSGATGGLTWAVPTDTNTVYAHPDHTGDVVSAADGATTIQANAVTTTKIADSGTPITLSCGTQTSTTVTAASTTGMIVGMTVSGAGIPLGATVISIIEDVSFGLSVAATATATVTLTFVAGVTTNKIAPLAVTYAKIQDVSATDRILGRDSAGAGVIEEITPANLRTMLNVADGAEANVAHDSLSGFVAEEHVDWAADGAGTIHASNYTDTNTEYTVQDGGLSQNNFTDALKTTVEESASLATAMAIALG